MGEPWGCRLGRPQTRMDAGGATDVIEACLAHKEQDKIRASYNKAQFAAERRDLLNAWGNYLSKI